MFKELRQLVSVILLSFILITFANTVFAQTYQSYEECINAFQSNNENYTDCNTLQKEADKCFQDAEKNGNEICNSQFAQQKSLCEATLNTECMDEVEKNISDCIAFYKNPQSTAACLQKKEAAKTCIADLENSFKEICRSQFPANKTTSSGNCGNGKRDKGEECDDGNTISGDGCDSTCMIEDVVPPSIPQISTLPGPEAANVSTVSPYLMSTFLPRVAKTVISFAIGAAVLGLILSSIGLLTAYGNEEKYGNAKKGLIFSLIGLVIALLAFAIVQLVFFTGFQIGNIT